MIIKVDLECHGKDKGYKSVIPYLVKNTKKHIEKNTKSIPREAYPWMYLLSKGVSRIFWLSLIRKDTPKGRDTCLLRDTSSSREGIRIFSKANLDT